jgi:NADH-quinone oxidoreductase subunit L
VADVPDHVFLMASAVLSWFAFFDVRDPRANLQGTRAGLHPLGGMAASTGRFRVDTLTAVMLVVVTTVSALVHIYSIGYMSHDPQPRASSAICRCSPSPC